MKELSETRSRFDVDNALNMTSSRSEKFWVDSRFNGPVASGNGGYCSGLAARRLEGVVEVTLRAPVPLNQEMDFIRTDDGANVLADDRLIMSLSRAQLQPPAIRSPGLAAVERNSHDARSVEDHVLPTCFVCGPARGPDDGLRISPAPLSASSPDNPNPFSLCVALWSPRTDLSDHDGLTASEFLWAALDCPGAFALNEEPILLGRMTMRILNRPPPGSRLLIAAWAAGSEGRKHYARTALFNEKNDLLAFSEQTWIKIARHAHLLV
jgi:hypothetical protein